MVFTVVVLAEEASVLPLVAGSLPPSAPQPARIPVIAEAHSPIAKTFFNVDFETFIIVNTPFVNAIFMISILHSSLT